MILETIYIGGWFQRTTLHLTEMYDFLKEGKSELGFPKVELTNYRNSLRLGEIIRNNWLLEYLTATSADGINLRIYEDGLITLQKDATNLLSSDFSLLENYYDNVLSPALSYIFSKGAPVPKELAQIKTLLPFVVVAKKASIEEVKKFFDELGQELYSDLETTHIRVYKSAKTILIVTSLTAEKVRRIVEEQVFFREFKTQLRRYLNIHRTIWEEIAAIKEQRKIPGNKISEIREKLDEYRKTIKLIESRINQMSTYLHTRAKIAADSGLDQFLDQVFAFKYESLEDTLAYIKELWKMTDNYLSSALELLTGLQAESTKTSISSLQLVTTLGVVAAIITYLGRSALPSVTIEGLVFFVLLITLTLVLNQTVSRYFSSRSYVIKKADKKL